MVANVLKLHRPSVVIGAQTFKGFPPPGWNPFDFLLTLEVIFLTMRLFRQLAKDGGIGVVATQQVVVLLSPVRIRYTSQIFTGFRQIPDFRGCFVLKGLVN